MTTNTIKKRKPKNWRNKALQYLENETKFGCLYILRKYVLECMSPDKLRDILRPKLGCILNMSKLDSIRLVSYIDDLLLPDMSLNAIKKWITQDIQDEELEELAELLKITELQTQFSEKPLLKKD